MVGGIFFLAFFPVILFEDLQSGQAIITEPSSIDILLHSNRSLLHLSHLDMPFMTL